MDTQTINVHLRSFLFAGNPLLQKEEEIRGCRLMSNAKGQVATLCSITAETRTRMRNEETRIDWEVTAILVVTYARAYLFRVPNDLRSDLRMFLEQGVESFECHDSAAEIVFRKSWLFNQYKLRSFCSNGRLSCGKLLDNPLVVTGAG